MADAPRPATTIPDAFEELHGARLHGFALLVTLGDRESAARLARGALVAGRARATALRHPERAAAWLRAWVVRSARDRSPRSETIGARRVALEDLGVDEATFAALAGLSLRERAALVATIIERLDQRDVATIVGVDGDALERLLARGRVRYMTARAAQDQAPPTPGPYVDHLAGVAARALR